MNARDGAIRRLVISLPPRHLKSLLVSVAFPAWLCFARFVQLRTSARAVF
jgi:hypothetical protein